jgi:hypothetical protein
VVGIDLLTCFPSAFSISGAAATVPVIAGEPIEMGRCTSLFMFRQQVLVVEADIEKLTTVGERIRSRDIPFSEFTQD